jgi:hypothetical protein
MAVHPVGDAGLRDVREQLGRSQQNAFGSHDTLLMVKVHEGHTMIAKRRSLLGEISAWRGEKPDHIPKLAERVGVVAGERIDIVSEERRNFVVEGEDRPFWSA